MLGAVVIGRNEGRRLVSCLDALVKYIDYIVYVDSGSTDNSLLEAKNRGSECLSLDMSIPFTAARARNEGAYYLIKKYPDLEFIQFIDGDCEIQPDWISTAQEFLEQNSQYAVVCGRRRERYPDHSIYNQLCDIEWDTPVGDAMACGGDALIRLNAFKQVNGYNVGLIAGEEPDMCFRLREKSWKIRRLDAEMVLHDAAITKFSQWWRRSIRGGYAFSEGAFLHGKSAEKYWVRERNSIFIWVIVFPLFIFLLGWINLWSLTLLAIYPIQVLRIYKNKKFDGAIDVKAKWALLTLASKFPQAIGQFKFVMNKLTNKTSQIIEYK